MHHIYISSIKLTSIKLCRLLKVMNALKTSKYIEKIEEFCIFVLMQHLVKDILIILFLLECPFTWSRYTDNIFAS